MSRLTTSLRDVERSINSDVCSDTNHLYMVLMVLNFLNNINVHFGEVFG